ncbi:DUF4238 domain-containing protein [Bradyrhizobium tunisiense]|uniref:DUF4238 domain-containing protein n=1 Tax=Bradyrhizobium tunisiense TaxID=3278709 RepID=UPI0035E14398
MSSGPAPKFSKDNQHFVPRFWIKRFAGSNGRILGRKRGEARAFQVAAGDVMTGDWTYTLFDGWWRPADKLEDALSVFEGEAATVMVAVDDLSSTLSPLLNLFRTSEIGSGLIFQKQIARVSDLAPTEISRPPRAL